MNDLSLKFQDVLQELGYDKPLNITSLHTGPERVQILHFLIAKLIFPASLEQMLSQALIRVQSLDIPSEEREAYGFVEILKNFGLMTTVDALRGCSDKRIEILIRIANIVRAASSIYDASESGTGGAAGQDNLMAEISLLDETLPKIPQLTSATGRLLPNDIATAAKPYEHLFGADNTEVLSQWTSALRSRISALSTRAEEFKRFHRVRLATDVEWQASLSAAAEACASFSESTELFLTAFRRSLGVWCLGVGECRTYGLGPLATTVLQQYSALVRTAQELSVVRNSMTQICEFKGNLKFLQPSVMEELLHAGAEKLSVISQQATVLQKILKEAHIPVEPMAI